MSTSCCLICFIWSWGYPETFSKLRAPMRSFHCRPHLGNVFFLRNKNNSSKMSWLPKDINRVICGRGLRLEQERKGFYGFSKWNFEITLTQADINDSVQASGGQEQRLLEQFYTLRLLRQNVANLVAVYCQTIIHRHYYTLCKGKVWRKTLTVC